jgi:hypothetical protein
MMEACAKFNHLAARHASPPPLRGPTERFLLSFFDPGNMMDHFMGDFEFFEKKFFLIFFSKKI